MSHSCPYGAAGSGGATVTALARLDGHPVGVIAATDPFRGATMSAEGALAVTRLADLCETFHLPMVSLTDQGGLAIGRVAEERGTIRHGARAIAAVYQAASRRPSWSSAGSTGWAARAS
jgi:acetyl-CoA carboxylase carboxyltransferase component